MLPSLVRLYLLASIQGANLPVVVLKSDQTPILTPIKIQPGQLPSGIAAAAGGASGAGNGPSGDRRETGWTPAGGIGGAIANARIEDFDIPNFLKWHPEAQLLACENDSKKVFPNFPEDLNTSIILLNKDGNPLTQRDVCGGFLRSDVFRSYRNLVVALYDAKDNPAFKELLQQTFDLGGPISIRVFKNRRNLPAGGGDIEEFTWFDSDSGAIGWGNRRKISTVLESFLSIPDASFLAHELGHVFTFRLFGGYPKEQIWHDLSYLHNPKYNPQYIGSEDFPLYTMKAPPEAAYIETFSNMMEFAFIGFGTHPMIFWQGLEGFVTLDGKKYDALYHLQFEAPLSVLEGSEAFLTTATYRFACRPYVGPKEELGNFWVDPSIVVKIIRAQRSLGKSTDIFALFKKYDEMNRTDEGWRWAREFFLYDFDQSRRIVGDFAYDKPNDLKDVWVHPTDKAPVESIFAPIIEDLKEKARDEGDKRGAAKVTRQQLIQNVSDSLSKAKANFDEFEKELPGYTEQAESLATKLPKKLTDYWWRNPPFDRPELGQLNMRVGGLVVLESVMDSIRAHAFLKDREDSLNKMIASASDLQVAVSSQPDLALSSPIHIEQVKRANSLNPDGWKRDVDNQILVLRFLMSIY